MKFKMLAQVMASSLSKPKQRIKLPTIPDGRVLDIGGGGEGIIARVGAARVIAIDKYASEIREAQAKAPDALWMLADACQLPFRNQSIDNATAFFSCMYMSDDVKQQVFLETRRVLKDTGEFWVWGARMTTAIPIFAMRLQVAFEHRKINTLYGAKAKAQSVNSLCDMLHKAGFATDIATDNKHWFLIKAR